MLMMKVLIVCLITSLIVGCKFNSTMIDIENLKSHLVEIR